MRSWLIGGLAALMLVSVAGCSRAISGTATIDPHRPGVALTDDYGILVGYPNAPVRLEIFTEPQCPACAGLQHKFGDEIGYHLLSGKLTVVYHPETFLDSLGTEYSAHVSNALFLAGASEASATSFQSYVMALWEHQDTEGSPGPSGAELAQWARESGIPEAAVQRIAAGDSGVDVDAMGEANFDKLSDVCAPYSAATPTVYNVNDDVVIDTWDDDWLNKLFGRT
jgi:hypothetical protein